MENILNGAIYVSLAIHAVMVGVAVWHVWRAQNIADRLVGVELVSTLFLAVLVLLALVSKKDIYIDVALGLAALGFISTIALAKYVADEQMY